MSNEELLGRIDERLTAALRQLDSIHVQTTSIDARLRDVEGAIETLQEEVKDLPKLKEKVDGVVTWKDQMTGSWKVVVAVSVVISFIVNSIIQFVRGS